MSPYRDGRWCEPAPADTGRVADFCEALRLARFWDFAQAWGEEAVGPFEGWLCHLYNLGLDVPAALPHTPPMPADDLDPIDFAFADLPRLSPEEATRRRKARAETAARCRADHFENLAREGAARFAAQKEGE